MADAKVFPKFHSDKSKARILGPVEADETIADENEQGFNESSEKFRLSDFFEGIIFKTSYFLGFTKDRDFQKKHLFSKFLQYLRYHQTREMQNTSSLFFLGSNTNDLFRRIDDKFEEFKKIHSGGNTIGSIAEEGESKTESNEEETKLLISISKSFHKNKKDFTKESFLRQYRNAVGGTLIHIAYLQKKYAMARALVEKYPILGAEPYDDRLPSRVEEWCKLHLQKYKFPMPYAGENILHMVIVRRNYDEVKWLLEFYSRQANAERMEQLLTSPTIGSFFSKTGSSYFGGYPLHAAACSNDIQIFDLVLSYTTNNKKDDMTVAGKDDTIKSKAKGSSIFLRDWHGNTILHLCVINCLPDMYMHVCATAYDLLVREITEKWLLQKGDDKSRIFRLDDPIFSTWLYGDNSISLAQHDGWGTITAMPSKAYRILLFWIFGDNRNNCFNNKDPHHKGVYFSGFPMHERLLEVPKGSGEHVHSPDDMSKVVEWIEKEAKAKVRERLILALNNSLHSPLTLAADELKADVDPRRVNMLQFMIEHLKNPLWTFGRIKRAEIALDGLEIPHDLVNYPVPDYISDNYVSFSALECLCRNQADAGFAIPEIKQIIDYKWAKCGYAPFLMKFFFHGVLTVFRTLILVLINSTPTFSPNKRYPAEMLLNIVYILTVLMSLRVLYVEFLVLFSLKEKYFSKNLVGIAKFDFRCMIIKLSSFLIFCICKTILAWSDHTNDYRIGDEKRGYEWNIQDFPVAKISLSICVLVSWFHMYYFLMGFDSTAPIVLTIFRVITTDIKVFFRFYLVSLFGFACAIAVITNQGNPSIKSSFQHLAWSIWNLIQATVQGDKTNFFPSIDVDNGIMSLKLAPADMKWMVDFLRTAYLGISNVLMINLLVAMISNTYNDYRNFSGSILVMEKYNIMASFERSMNESEVAANRKKYSRRHTTHCVYELDYNSFSHLNFEELRPEIENVVRRGSVFRRITESFENIAGQTASLEKVPSDKSTGSPSKDIDKSDSYKDGIRARLSGIADALHLQDNAGVSTSKVAPIEKEVFHKHTLHQNIFEYENINSGAWEKDTSPNDSSKGSTNTTLLIIHPQNDFHVTGKSLKNLEIDGANEDSERIAKMITVHWSRISEIIVTKDHHQDKHIAHADFWVGTNGESPNHFTEISYIDVINEKWKPRDPSYQKWCEYYTFNLERKGRMKIVIWPKHCIQGTQGNNIVPVLQDAIKTWQENHKELALNKMKSAQKGVILDQSMLKTHIIVEKGQGIRTEMYSILEAEVIDPADSASTLDKDLLARLGRAERLLICGQALSHCVNYTLRDLIRIWPAEKLKNVTLLKDGCSSVAHFENVSQELVDFARFSGVKISTTQLAFPSLHSSPASCNDMVTSFIEKDPLVPSYVPSSSNKSAPVLGNGIAHTIEQGRVVPSSVDTSVVIRLNNMEQQLDGIVRRQSNLEQKLDSVIELLIQKR